MDNNLEKKFVLAFRPRYNSENIVDYKYHNKSKIRCYLVLKEYEMDLLVAELNFFEKGNLSSLRLSSDVYPFFRSDSIINGYVTMISKNAVINESKEYINESDFIRVMNNLKGRNYSFFDKDNGVMFGDFCCEYYEPRINVGSVVCFRSDSGFLMYYVKEKYNDSFLGVKLHYDFLEGLSVTNEEEVISYNNSFVDIFYERDFSARVLSMINKH